MTTPLRISFDVACPAEHAFRVWTSGIPLGAADEGKDAAEGTVEAWGRSADNPVGGWYGLRRGYRGRFGMYVPPLLEALGLAELTHEARNNRMRACGSWPPVPPARTAWSCSHRRPRADRGLRSGAVAHRAVHL
jgi:hypothetical protein